jgi:2-polyprenyl-3-methyl-5-hydroxy-6-metoxy-1,4-benzoquinol methylase
MSNKRVRMAAEVARVYNDNFADLVLFTRKSENEIIELLKNALSERNKEWEILSEQSILNYHRSNEFSMFCLTKWNSEERYQEIIKYITFICKKLKGKILDFGGGTGELSIHLATNSLDVDFLEVPGKTMNFAKWRFQRMHLEINTFTSLNHVEKYDIIICLDVLETLEKPLAHLRKFHQLLNKNGTLILSIGEVGSVAHPMNLEKNRAFLENIDKHCQDIGFTDSNFENKFHLKIKQKI